MLAGKEHLFGKQLSKHSIGAYMELFREVGSSFEAVVRSGEATRQDRNSDSGPTFSSKITDLEKDKLSLLQDLCESESRVERAEKEIDRLKCAIHALEQRGAHKAELISQYRNITVKSLEDAKIALEKYRVSSLAGERGWGGFLDGTGSSQEVPDSD